MLDDILRIARSALNLLGDRRPKQLDAVAGVAQKVGERERELLRLGADAVEEAATIVEKHK